MYRTRWFQSLRDASGAPAAAPRVLAQWSLQDRKQLISAAHDLALLDIREDCGKAS